MTDQSLWTASIVAEKNDVYQAGNQSQAKANDSAKADAQTLSQDNANVRLKTFN